MRGAVESPNVELFSSHNMHGEHHSEIFNPDPEGHKCLCVKVLIEKRKQTLVIENLVVGRGLIVFEDSECGCIIGR